MSNDEYILAFESILYGLIVSRILVKWNLMIQDDQPKKHYWAFWLFSISVFLLIIYVFVMNRMTDHYQYINDAKSFLFYAVIPPALFTFIVYQLFPKEFKGVDLKEYLMNNRYRIITPLIIYIILNLIQFSGSIFDLGTIIGMFCVFFSVITLLSKRYWMLELFIIIMTVSILFAGYI